MASSSSKKSTIVRARTRLMTDGVRTAFGLAERWAPKTGSRWAERIWLTLPRSPWKPKDGLAVPPGEEFELAVGVSTVHGEVWGGDGPVVYLVHGWGGYRSQLDAFVPPLLASGHRVVAFDVPGHGESTPGAAGPRRGLLPEFMSSLNAAVERFGPAQGVIAHSFGSAATGLAVLDGLEAANLAFIAPMGDPIAFSHGFAQMLGFGERIRSGFLRVLEQRVGRPMSDFVVTTRARAALPGTLPPLLIVHDLKDREIPVKAGEELAEAWPGAEFEGTEGLGHYRILRDASVIRCVVDFVSQKAVVDRTA